VSWLLRIKQVPFEYISVMPGGRKQGGSREAGFVEKFNPAGQVPVIKDGDFVLYESNAILIYLAEKYQWTDVYPADPQKRAAVNQWMHWHHQNSREVTLGHFAPVMRPDLAKAFTADILSQKRARTKATLQQMQTQLSKTPFLAGDHFTLADICCFADIGQFSPRQLGIVDFSPFPDVEQWMKRMEALPAYEESHELLQTIKPRFEKAVQASKTQSKM
jgi:glutathione S-transferase